MKVGKLNSLLSAVNRLKTVHTTVRSKENAQSGPAERVDISSAATKNVPVETVQNAVLEFKTALIGTLSAGSKSSIASIYDLAGTPVDRFARNRFAQLSKSERQEFMENFKLLSKTAGGLAPGNLVKLTFGQTGGFAHMIEQIGESLNRFL